MHSNQYSDVHRFVPLTDMIICSKSDSSRGDLSWPTTFIVWVEGCTDIPNQVSQYTVRHYPRVNRSLGYVGSVSELILDVSEKISELCSLNVSVSPEVVWSPSIKFFFEHLRLCLRYWSYALASYRNVYSDWWPHKVFTLLAKISVRNCEQSVGVHGFFYCWEG
jgi:hypothetical protein